MILQFHSWAYIRRKPYFKKIHEDFPGGRVVKNSPANAGDTVGSLVKEDPPCHGATKPTHHNY